MNKIQRQANFHNENMRKVKYVYSYSYKNFLSQSSGNLLINGGLKDKRRECLLQTIVDARDKGNESIIVFSEDDSLQEQLIALAKNGEIGQLYVCSEEYPIYDFFCGMRRNFASEYFNRIALERGFRDTTELNGYVDSFLSILSTQMPVNLTSIRHFARNDDVSIAEASIEPLESNMIISSSRGSVAFRSLLNNTYNAFSTITTPSCATSVSLNNLINKDCVVLIHIPTYNSEIFSIYFAMELKSIMNESFSCIFDDSITLNSDIMRSVVEIMKQRQKVTVIVSHENIISVSNTDEIIKNFNRNLIFLNGNTPYVDLQKILSDFGQYTHMQPMVNKSTPPRLFFTFYRGEGEATVPYSRDRVILQEEYGNEALLKGGSSAEIVITKRLII